jgi:hypothetical protein
VGEDEDEAPCRDDDDEDISMDRWLFFLVELMLKLYVFLAGASCLSCMASSESLSLL